MRWSQPPEHAVDVEGAKIAYRRSGPADAPALLLVHGGGAHGAWFAGMVPLLEDRFCVLVPDLSGHGDSQRRSTYSPQVWEAELAAVIDSAGVHKAAVVGHSMGGFVTTHFVANRPELVDAAVFIETRSGTNQSESARIRGRSRRPARVYETRQAALDRFRYVPAQPTVNGPVTEIVAEASVVEVEQGWTWKTDPEVYGRFDLDELTVLRGNIKVPTAYLYGEHGDVCDDEAAQRFAATANVDVEVRRIPGAYHHAVIDQPEACVDAITDFLGRVMG